MTDEAAESRRPVTAQDATSPLPGPAPSTPHAEVPDGPTEPLHPATDPTLAFPAEPPPRPGAAIP
ncbi:hypothetical protein ACFQ0D_15720, partial [Micromonospora zhanjiangensis]